MWWQETTWRRALAGLSMGVLMAGGAQAAFDFDGTKTVLAVAADGKQTAIATVQFAKAAGGKSSFKVDLKPEVMTDYFLSMREFKCLPANKEITCYVRYPYKTPDTVGAGDLAWLEHHLLFLYKTPAEFGAKLWNGVYFELHEEGNRLVGTPQAIDLNEISSPPEDLSVPPYGKTQRHEIPDGARWIRQIVIE